MRDEFVITLRREQTRRTSLAGFCLLLFSFIAFLFNAFRSGLQPPYTVIGAVVMLLGIGFNSRMALRRQPTAFRIWLLAAALGWIFMPRAEWMLVPYIFFAAWETRAGSPLKIVFSPAGVVINSFIKRRIAWNQLHSVLLKDGLLTMDFKNNRLMQREESPEDAVEERAFNDYVRRQIGVGG